jgi:NADPH-dependent curcumin reductase CurA
MKNRRLVLKKRATGLPGPEHFELREDEAPEPDAGQVLYAIFMFPWIRP